MKIVLAHALGRTPASFALLLWRLRRAGHKPETFSYFAFAERHDAMLERLVTRLRPLAKDGRPVGLIGHSFGGLLLRQALPMVPGLRVHHFVMLGVPNNPPRMAGVASGWRVWRAHAGEVGERLADPKWFESLPPVRVPYTVVAGTMGWRGRRSPFGDEPNDGILAVSETLVAPDDKPVELRAIHAMLMNARGATRLILDAFKV